MMKTKQKNVLVCGGSGFIGTNLVEKFLKKKNLKIFNIDKISYCSVPEKFKKYKDNNNYFFYKLNINQSEKIKKIILNNNIETIINLANESHVDKSIESPEKFILKNFKDNLTLINLLAKLQKKKNFSYIHISTDEVYGDYQKKPNSEYDRLEPNSPYSVSKAAIDILLNAYNKTFNFKYTILRACNQFGRYQFPEKFLPTVIFSLYKNKKIPLYGNGQNIREWMHIDRFVSIIFQIMSKKKLQDKCKTINVGSGKRLTNEKMIHKIIRLYNIEFKKKINSKSINYILDRPGHDKQYSIKSNDLKKMNITNEYNLNDSLKKTIKWYCKNKSWTQYTKKKYNGVRQGLIRKDL